MRLSTEDDPSEFIFQKESISSKNTPFGSTVDVFALHEKLLGKTGKVTVTISDIDETRPVWDRNYKATVILKDVHFIEENGNNSDITLDELIFKDVRVGWLPG